MTKFTLWTYGNGTPETVNVKDGEDPRDAFQRVTAAMKIDPDQVYSFWEVGKSLRQDSNTPNGLTVSMWDRAPGQEWIFHVRDLPKLDTDAFVILASHFGNPKSSLTLHNQESRLTERSRAAFDTLIEAGLITEEPVDGGYPEARRYALTDAGKSYPRNISLDYARKHGQFSLVEKIDPECASRARRSDASFKEKDRSAEPEDGPEM